MNPVLFDCDGGSDDAWALILLLKAHEQRKIHLAGITVSGNGNTDLENAALNMLRILKACGHMEIPLYLGARESLLNRDRFDESCMFHGNDGFGDILDKDESIKLKETVQETHAVVAINELIRQYPRKVSIICVGPCTNLALCYSMFGSEISKNIKSLFVMGGNIKGVGNISRSAEFNFYADPEAANVILSKSKCPITIMPWETCIGESITMTLKWRLENMTKDADFRHPVLNILDLVEAAQYGKHGFANWTPCDAFLVAAFLFESFVVTATEWHAVVDLKGEYTRGQMVLDHLKNEKINPKNVRVIESVDEKLFIRIIYWSLGHICDVKDN